MDFKAFHATKKNESNIFVYFGKAPQDMSDMACLEENKYKNKRKRSELETPAIIEIFKEKPNSI